MATWPQRAGAAKTREGGRGFAARLQHVAQFDKRFDAIRSQRDRHFEKRNGDLRKPRRSYLKS
jgi:hypothetical protein